MADVIEQTCLFCLQANELPSMVRVEMKHLPVGIFSVVITCRLCAGAIADAWQAIQLEENPEAPTEKGEGDS